jgi:hypothetical protein
MFQKLRRQLHIAHPIFIILESFTDTMFTSKAKKEKSKTFLSFLRRKKKGAREETSKEKKQGAKSKKCPSSIMETKERKVSRTQSIKTTITSTGSMCDESDTYSIYSIDVMAEASVSLSVACSVVLRTST